MRNLRLLSLCLFLLPQISQGAEGLKSLPDSAAAMGAIGARFSTLKDPSVTRTNPASLTDLDGAQFQANFQLWYGETSFVQAGTGLRDDFIDHWKPTGSLYYTRPINDTLSFGVGVGVPFGVSISWPQEGTLRFATPFETSLTTVAINPALGLKINDKVSAGAGLDIFVSDLNIRQFVSFSAATGFPFPDGNLEFDASGTGLGAYGSVNIDINERQRLSLIGRLPVSVDYEGNFTVTNIPAPLSPLFAERSDLRSEIEYPGSISLGYAIDLTDKTTVGFDFDWTFNSSHDDIPLDIGLNQPLLGGAQGQQLEWKNSYSAGFGIVSEATDALTLRGGYLYSESPINDRFFTPAIPANDRHIFSLGAGYKFKKNSIDAAISYIHLEDRDIRNNIDPRLNGQFDPDWYILTLSYTRHF